MCSEDKDRSGVVVVCSGERCNTGVFCGQGSQCCVERCSVDEDD